MPKIRPTRAGPIASLAVREERQDRFEHRDRGGRGHHGGRARRHRGHAQDGADRHGVVRNPAVGDLEPQERGGAGQRERRDEQEQPAADGRSEHEGEIRAAHHEPHHAPTLLLVALPLSTIEHRRNIRALAVERGTSPPSVAGVLAALIAVMGLLAFVAALFRG
jgi:hypothetical protein